MTKCLLRNNGFGIVQLPKEMWQKLGWNVSDEVGVQITKRYDEDGNNIEPVITIEKLRGVEEWRKEEEGL